VSDDHKTVDLRDRDVERLRASVRDDPAEDTFAGLFEVVREAGAGGMGKVYEAIERATSRRVAIKVITGLPGPSERARFAAEIEVIERLDHPAIVDYVAHGETSNGEPYLAMEWLVGDSLSTRLDRGTLSLVEAAFVGERIADALDHAHDHGVVHRDLKPSNIFLVDGKASEAHLIDFGIAKHSGKDLTRSGQLVGTPGYMAPEQARGEKTINASADLFALGCVLYRALAGRDAFEGAEVMEILARLLLEDPPPLAQLRPDVPPRFAHLVGSLLSKDAAKRLGDAAVARDELRSIRVALDATDVAALGLKPDQVPTPQLASPPTVRSSRPKRSKRWLAIAAGLAAVGLAVVLIVRPWSSSSPDTTALRQKARAAEADRRHAEAAKAYQDAYAIDPDPDLLFSIAEQFEALRRSEDALHYFRRYLHEADEVPDRADIDRRIKQLEEWYAEELRELGRGSSSGSAR
jgi:serine/threonine protein kinase